MSSNPAKRAWWEPRTCKGCQQYGKSCCPRGYCAACHVQEGAARPVGRDYCAEMHGGQSQ